VAFTIPYRQAPEINSQRQTEDAIGGENPANHQPAPQINPSRDQQYDHAGEHASEIAPLGIKPGEWLLSIITLMLWGATVGLVRGADKTAEKQLRAYVSVESGVMFRQKKGLRFEFRPNVINNGLTPAKDVRIVSNLGVVSPVIPENSITACPFRRTEASPQSPLDKAVFTALSCKRG
jgi:hypothetical protein